MIEIPRWEELDPARVSDGSLIRQGYLPWSQYANAWGTTRTPTQDRLRKLVKAGLAEEIDSSRKAVKLWKLKKP